MSLQDRHFLLVSKVASRQILPPFIYILLKQNDLSAWYISIKIPSKNKTLLKQKNLFVYFIHSLYIFKIFIIFIICMSVCVLKKMFSLFPTLKSAGKNEN